MRSSAPESSKRLFGAIGFITAIIYIAVWGHELIETLLYVSAALLGLESITQIFKKK
jgi:formate/nitrite transporter FocA (FNT family)